jgi:presenilin-like A22 family membrane protease
MKYNLKIISVLVSLFFIAQIVGLSILYKDTKVELVDGKQEVVHGETVIGPRPEFYGPQSFIWIISSIFLMTGLLLILIKFEKINWVKVLFFSATFLTLSVALGVLISPDLAFILGLVLAVIKIYKPNKITHNIIEMLMYSGLAVILVPLFDLTWMILLLIVISAYDIYAVWRSRHMIKMATFQMKSKIFTGLLIPLKASVKKRSRVKGKGVKVEEAIMGSGDVAFPLMYSGVVMERLIKVGQLAKELAFVKTLIIPVIVSLVVLFLLIQGKRGKYYPGMPFITGGCLLGSLFVLII